MENQALPLLMERERERERERESHPGYQIINPFKPINKTLYETIRKVMLQQSINIYNILARMETRILNNNELIKHLPMMLRKRGGRKKENFLLQYFGNKKNQLKATE